MNTAAGFPTGLEDWNSVCATESTFAGPLISSSCRVIRRAPMAWRSPSRGGPTPVALHTILGPRYHLLLAVAFDRSPAPYGSQGTYLPCVS